MTSQLLPCTHLTSLYVCLCADSGTDSRAQTSSDRLPAWTLTRRRSRRCQCSAQRAAASLRACTFSLPAYYASLITIVLAFWLSIASSAVTSLQDVAASQYLVLYCPGCCSVHQIPESFACACAKYACTLHASIELTVSTCLSACSNPHLDNLCSKCNRERQASEATANAIASTAAPAIASAQAAAAAPAQPPVSQPQQTSEASAPALPQQSPTLPAIKPAPSTAAGGSSAAAAEAQQSLSPKVLEAVTAAAAAAAASDFGSPQQQEQQASAAAAEEAAGEEGPPRRVQRNTNRCFSCNKKVHLSSSCVPPEHNLPSP